MASPPTSRDDFEIAIICALVEEYNAVTELVDHFWGIKATSMAKLEQIQTPIQQLALATWMSY